MDRRLWSGPMVSIRLRTPSAAEGTSTIYKQFGVKKKIEEA